MTQRSGPIPAGSPDVTMIRGTYTYFSTDITKRCGMITF
jgi:hypothetical protein